MITILIVMVVTSTVKYFYIRFPEDRAVNKVEIPEEEHYEDLVLGKLAYNIPDTMTVGRQYTASVYITKAVSDSILLYANRTTYNPRAENTVFEDSIPISSRVKARLFDPKEDNVNPWDRNFSVKTVSSELQTVDDSTSTVWKWYVTPLREGRNSLELVITTQVTDKWGTDFKDIPAYTKVVNVKSDLAYSTRNFWDRNWQWLLSVILLPFTIWGFNEIRKYRQKKAAEKEEAIKQKLVDDLKREIGFKTGGNKADQK